LQAKSRKSKKAHHRKLKKSSLNPKLTDIKNLKDYIDPDSKMQLDYEEEMMLSHQAYRMK